MSNEIETSKAVQWWLEKEAANSTFNNNKGLDNLEQGRQALLNHTNPKDGHYNRMRLWLGTYETPSLRPDEQASLTANTAFGALMFLSGSYRRQRYLQATSQDDYYDRKADWIHPGGVVVPEFLPPVLREAQQSTLAANTITALGLSALQNSLRVLDVIYDRVPDDFDTETSPSIRALNNEQVTWLILLSKVLVHSSQNSGVALEEVPVLEPETIAKAQPTTLSALLATKL